MLLVSISATDIVDEYIAICDLFLVLMIMDGILRLMCHNRSLSYTYNTMTFPPSFSTMPGLCLARMPCNSPNVTHIQCAIILVWNIRGGRRTTGTHHGTMKVLSSLLPKRRLESNARPARTRAGRGLPDNGMSEAEEVESIKQESA